MTDATNATNRQAGAASAWQIIDLEMTLGTARRNNQERRRMTYELMELGFSAEQIAEVVGLSPATIRQRMTALRKVKPRAK